MLYERLREDVRSGKKGKIILCREGMGGNECAYLLRRYLKPPSPFTTSILILTNPKLKKHLINVPYVIAS